MDQKFLVKINQRSLQHIGTREVGAWVPELVTKLMGFDFVIV